MTIAQPDTITDIRKIYRVSEVTKDIRTLLEDNFASIWITGEVSNFKRAVSGHCYFTLKDESSNLAAVMFRQQSQRLKFAIEDGMEIIVHGRISVFESRGQYQIIVDAAEPKGIGALQLAFEQLKKKLAVEGLFDPAHKKLLPFLPQKIGLVTSSKGAAVHDMVTVLTRRFPNIHILIYPVKVQGEGSAVEIARAIVELNTDPGIDLLIVGRGGGSLEDLWAFNEEVVVRAIFNSALPIISAVGHETDFTLADFVADVRAPTPSVAAELAVPVMDELLQTIAAQRSGLHFATRQRLQSLREKIGFYKKSIKSPRQILEDWVLRVDEQADRLNLFAKRLFVEKKLALKGLRKTLLALSPFALLQRGYSVVTREGSLQPIRSVDEVKTGENLSVRLHEGMLKVKVN